MQSKEEAPKVGSRLTCSSCGAQVVIVKAGDRAIKCCGQPLGE